MPVQINDLRTRTLFAHFWGLRTHSPRLTVDSTVDSPRGHPTRETAMTDPRRDVRTPLSEYVTHPLPFYPVMQRMHPDSFRVMMKTDDLAKPLRMIRDTLTSATTGFQDRKIMTRELYDEGHRFEHDQLGKHLSAILDHVTQGVAHANQRSVRIERAGWTELTSAHRFRADSLAKGIYVHLVLTGALMPDEHARVTVDERNEIHTMKDAAYIESVRTWTFACVFYQKGF